MRSGTSKRRRVSAFTLIEVLIVIGLMAILVAMVVPVVQTSTREASQVAFVADLRIFADAAWVHASDALSFEKDQTLASVGSGIELQVLRNLSIRFDTGVVLSPIETSGGLKLADVGDMEFYVVGTLLY